MRISEFLQVELSLIHEIISNYFYLDKDIIFKKTRVEKIIEARQWFHYFSRVLNPEYKISSKQIGSYYSDITGVKSDHATVLHSVNKIKGYISVHKKDKEKESYLRNLILDKHKQVIYLKKQVNNQHQQALWYLINWDSFSLKDVINDSMFYKFQTRLSEIETEHGKIAKRKKVYFTNRFKRKSNYNIYSCIDKKKAKKIFFKY